MVNANPYAAYGQQLAAAYLSGAFVSNNTLKPAAYNQPANPYAAYGYPAQQNPYASMAYTPFNQYQPPTYSAQPSYGYNPYAQAAPQQSYGYNPYAQAMPQQGYGYNPYAQAAPQQGYGYNPYAQAAPQQGYGYNPYAQQSNPYLSGFGSLLNKNTNPYAIQSQLSGVMNGMFASLANDPSMQILAGGRGF